MTPDRLTLRADEPLAIEFTAALKQGDPSRLERLLAADPALANCMVMDGKGGGRTTLHLFADWPGRCPNAHAVVTLLAAAGADLDAPAVASWHRETPLHWAASNDDVTLIDALLDAGADIERGGSSINGGSPLCSAVGYGQFQAARRLVARGAVTELWHEAALGLLDKIKRRLDADPLLRGEALGGPLWNACHGGELATAQFLVSHGADPDWLAPWTRQTPLDIAESAGRRDVVAWLLGTGARRGAKAG
jgi:ankyrin repeat protein